MELQTRAFSTVRPRTTRRVYPIPGKFGNGGLSCHVKICMSHRSIGRNPLNANGFSRNPVPTPALLPSNHSCAALGSASMIALDPRWNTPWTVVSKFLELRKPPMKLFSITFALSAIATFTAGMCYAQDAGGSGSAPIPRARFEKTPAQHYLMMRARQDSEHRAAVLRQYESAGYNFGQPEFNGNYYFASVTPRNRRFIVMQNYSFLPGNEYGY